MQSKSLLIAIAAFAMTTTAVSAHGGIKILEKAGLNENQIEAIEEARELRQQGDYESARDILVDAGIDEDVLRNIHKVAKEEKRTIHEALVSGDYEAFIEAIEDSPLSDIITTEADFQQFQDAHMLRKSGDWEEAEEILDELGIEPKMNKGHHGKKHGHLKQNLTEEQKEALRVAKESNDREAVRAIMEEAGVERGYGKEKNRSL